MGYYMRFISVDERDVSLGVLEAALRQADAAYLIERGEEAGSAGALTYGGEVYGEIEVNRPGDSIFAEELEELEELVGEAEGERKPEVLGVLRRAKAIIAVRVSMRGSGSEETLEKIDPLWQWLTSNREGLAQADGEGYYDASGLVLWVE